MPRAELAHDALVVDHLPHQVRRVEVEPERVAVEVAEHVAPRRRRVHQVVAAGPLVVGEDHRAVLDGDLHALVGGVGDDVRPDLGELGEVLLQRLVLVVADERVDDGHAELRGGLDDVSACGRSPRRGGRGRGAAGSGSSRGRRSRCPARRDRRRGPWPRRRRGWRSRCATPRRSAATGRRPAASRPPRASRSRWPPPSRRPRSAGCRGRRRSAVRASSCRLLSGSVRPSSTSPSGPRR